MTDINEEPIQLRVYFNAPESTVIELQGPALQAYKEYLEDESDDAEEVLANAIMEQCEYHVAMWTTLDEWDVA